jgi:hypothetical protein
MAARPSHLSLQNPPTTYYGRVLSHATFTPTPGLTVQAWIDGQLCRQGQTQDVEGQVSYSLNVNPAGSGGSIGCGQADRHVQVTLNGQPLSASVQWDNNAVWQIDLIPAALRHIYLPIVLK